MIMETEFIIPLDRSGMYCIKYKKQEMLFTPELLDEVKQDILDLNIF